VLLDTVAWGLFEGNNLALKCNGRSELLHYQKLILATGASENALAFPGWTLPGVMGAGAAQTLVNIHRVLPGRRVLMVGAGNVGLIVSYQLLQAGAEVVAVIEALPRIGMSELAWMAGCQFTYIASLGGHIPLHDENMETTVPGIYVAGDIAGIEEASTAMEEGRLAGLAAAEALGYIAPEVARERKAAARRALDELRAGPFGEARRQAKIRIVEACHEHRT